MTRAEILDCLTDRPCDYCKFHESGRCERWNCVFEEKPDEMTREEAIGIMRVIVHMLEEKYDTDRVEDAVDLAIKALSAEPSEALVREWCKQNGYVMMSEAVYESDMIKTYFEGQNTEPCEDAISRQTVMDFIRGLTRWCVRSEDGKFNNVGLLYDDVMFGLDRLPSVTPKQRTGHWIKVDDEEPIAYDCSECGVMVSRRYRFCLDCGAKMAESEDTE